MIIKNMKICDLIPANYNPRKDLKEGDIEYEKLKASLERFELVEPLVMNVRTNTLISGHQRLKILKDLGYDTVDVVIVDLSPKEEKLLNLNLNKICSEWDFSKLEDLFKEFEVDNLKITGFDLEEITGILDMNIEENVKNIQESNIEISKQNFIPNDESNGKKVDIDTNKNYFIVYLPFSTEELAYDFLKKEGFAEKRFCNMNTMRINMENTLYEN